MLSKAILSILWALILLIPAGHAAYAQDAEAIFNKISPMVYQVRVIDKTTSEKGSIGSGFLMNYNGKQYFITNYHVISQYALDPDKNRIEYHNNDEKLGDLKLGTIDVVHDLALLEGAKAGPVINPAQYETLQGATIFSLGNPMDLGLNIIEGTHNGYKQQTWRDIYMFSGALNPGMSGGAAVNATGQLIGVNVAMQGNDVGFLVPLKYVIAMIEHYEAGKHKEKWKKVIQEQTIAAENRLLNELLKNKPWESPDEADERFVHFPVNIHKAIKCWGESDDEKEDELYLSANRYCSSDDRIFIDGGTEFQRIDIRSTQMENLSLPAWGFYSVYSTRFRVGGYPSAGKTRKCKNGFLKQSGYDWRTAMCVDSIKDFPNIYNISLVLARLGHTDLGQIIDIELNGFSKQGAERLMTAVMEEIK